MGVLSLAARDIREPDPALTLLGYTVFWRFSGVCVQRQALAQALTRTAFSNALPPLPSPAIALRRALLAFTHQSRAAGTLLLRTVSRKPGMLVLIEEVPDQQGNLCYRTHLRARYDAATQEVFCTTLTSGPIDATTEKISLSVPVRLLFAQARETYSGADLSCLVRTLVLACQAVRLQRGIYFVPVSQSEPLQRLDMLVGLFPGSPLFATLAQVDERRTRAQLVHAIHANLMHQLQTVETRLRQLRSAGGQPEMDTLCQYLMQVREVQQKAQVYTELLGARVQEIQTRLGALHADMQRLILFDMDEVLP